MTEVLPVTGRTYSHGHLHHDLNTGHVEYLDLHTGEPATPGALATVVITPYFPYRDCMPVFRYDTRDVIRPLDHDKLTCEVAGLPGCSPVLGKADQLIHLGPGRIITPRQIVEALKSLPNSPWPGRLRLALPESTLTGLSSAQVIGHLAEHGLAVELDLVPDREAKALRPLRCDLQETTFTTRPAAPIGA